MVAGRRLLWGLAAWVVVSWVASVFAGGALAAPFVYVANNTGTNVSQYDGSAGALSPLSPATVATRFGTLGAAVSPDGTSAYVTNGGGTVSQYTIDPATGQLAPKTPATVAAGGGPQGVAVSPDGKSAYVANQFGTVSQYTIDPATGALTPMTPASVPSGSNPKYVAVSPDGKSVYVTNQLGANPGCRSTRAILRPGRSPR